MIEVSGEGGTIFLSTNTSGATPTTQFTTAALGGLTTLGGLEGIRIWSRIHRIHTLKDSNLSNPKLLNLAHP